MRLSSDVRRSGSGPGRCWCGWPGRCVHPPGSPCGRAFAYRC
nr:putative integron gene cassette protein [uncultured bacterium]